MSNRERETIHFILTGGTIDSYYEGTKDTVVPNNHSIIPRYIESFKLYTKPKFTEICMKDSRGITNKDLKKILKEVKKSNSKKIIITHGTYTMPDSARFLKANLKKNDQTIILTGSMLPIREFTMSDGGFNLGYAIAKLEDLKSGIYICMNGKVFSSDETIKTISEGRFTSILGER